MHQNIPHHIRDLLQGEPVDFIVQSAHNYLKRKAGKTLLGIFFAFSWLYLFPLFFILPLVEVIISGETSITINGVHEIYTRTNLWGPLYFAIIPTMVSMIFLIPLTIFGINCIAFMRDKGPWFAVTNTHLIEIDGTNASYYPWNTFEEQIKTKMYKDGEMDIVLSRKGEFDRGDTVNNQTIRENSQAQSFNMNISLNGKQVDLAKILQERVSYKTIGILKVPHGTHLLNMIRHNMERYGK